MPDELLFRPECQAAHPGMDTVRADHQVEPARRTVFEFDLDGIGGFTQRADRIAEHVSAVPGRESVEDLGEIAPQDLDIAAGEVAGHAGLFPAAGIDEDHIGGPGTAPPDLVVDTHPLEHPALHGPLEVDGLTAGRRAGARSTTVTSNPCWSSQ